MTTETPVEPKEVKAPANGKTSDDEPEVLDLTKQLAPVRRLVKLPTKKAPTGESYELRLLDDFGVEQQQQLLSWSRKFTELYNAEEELKPAQVERMRFVLDNLFDSVLDAPKAVKKDMTDAIRTRVVAAFSMMPLIMRQEAAVKEREKEVLTRLVDKEYLTQAQVDEVLQEIEDEENAPENQ